MREIKQYDLSPLTSGVSGSALPKSHVVSGCSTRLLIYKEMYENPEKMVRSKKNVSVSTIRNTRTPADVCRIKRMCIRLSSLRLRRTGRKGEVPSCEGSCTRDPLPHGCGSKIWRTVAMANLPLQASKRFRAQRRTGVLGNRYVLGFMRKSPKETLKG